MKEFEREVTMNSKLNFQPLTAVNDADINGYREYFTNLLNQDTVTNIAITGPYGSGKSSFIETYKEYIDEEDFSSKKLKKSDFLHIKIGSFSGNENSNDLERRIINNLRYAAKPEDLTGTTMELLANEKVALDDSTVDVCLFLTMCVLVMLILAIYAPFGVLWKIISLVLMSALALDLIRIVFNSIGNKFNFTKLSFDKVSIEMEKNNKNDPEQASYFDTFMVDVMMLFKKIDKKVIVFEDLDRFDNTYIFEKLREINIILNAKNNGEFVFVYLIKHDLFEYQDATKFFDGVIPLIPVMDRSNSYQKFIELLNESDNENVKKLDKDKLERIISFTGDLRFLYSLYNEFLLYTERLSTTNLDLNRMLAILMYKGLFPKDFTLLQDKAGILSVILGLKDELKTKKENELRGKNSSIQEIDAVQYMSMGKLLFGITDEEIWQMVEKKLEIGTDIEKLYNEEIRKLSYKNFLILAVRENLIDKNYNQFISHVYTSDISVNDNEIQFAIIQGTENVDKLDIDDPKAIFKKIKPEDIRNRKVQNLMLAVGAITLANVNKQFANEFMIVAQENENIEFVLNWYKGLKNDDEIVLLNEVTKENWPEYLTIAILKENAVDNIGFVRMIAVAADESLSASFNDRSDIMSLASVDLGLVFNESQMIQDKYLDKISLLNQMFSDIRFDDSQLKDYQKLMQKDLININVDTLNTLFEKFEIDIAFNDWKDNFISDILKIDSESLKEYLSVIKFENLLDLISSKKDEYSELEDGLQYLIENASEELVKNYLTKLKLKTNINDITKYSTVYWDTLIQNGNMELSFENIWEYFYKNEDLSPELIKQVNTVRDISRSDDENSEKLETFIAYVIQESSLKDETAVQLATLTRLKYKSGIVNINNLERTKLLVSKKVFVTNKENINSAIEMNIAVLDAFAEVNGEVFIDTIRQSSNPNKDALLVRALDVSIEEDKSDEIIQTILNAFSVPISLNEKYPDWVNNWIIEQLPNKDEVLALVTSKEVNKAQHQSIAKFLNANEDITGELVIQDRELLNELLENVDLNTEKRQIILSYNLDKFSNDEIESILKIVGMVKLATSLGIKNPRLPRNNQTTRIAKELEKRNLISSIKYEENTLQIWSTKK